MESEKVIDNNSEVMPMNSTGSILKKPSVSLIAFETGIITTTVVIIAIILWAKTSASSGDWGLGPLFIGFFFILPLASLSTFLMSQKFFSKAIAENADNKKLRSIQINLVMTIGIATFLLTFLLGGSQGPEGTTNVFYFFLFIVCWGVISGTQKVFGKK